MSESRRVFTRTLAAWSLVLAGFAVPAAAEHVELVNDINPSFLTGLGSGAGYFFDANGEILAGGDHDGDDHERDADRQRRPRPHRRAAEQRALNGTGSSDPDGTITYAWRQLSGPVVTLTNATTAQPVFTAPHVNATTAMDFELKVTDDNGATAIDVVRITVIK
jgi:hypothetical protein